MRPPAFDAIAVVLRDMGIDARLSWADDGYVAHIAEQLQTDVSE
jgi:hypothetical protein